MTHQAIVLAGGEGRRLRPYTSILPKPLMPVGDGPLLEIIVKQLRRAGFTRIVLAVNHLHHIIQSFFGDGRSWGVELQYSVEDRPLGTCGPLGVVLSQMEDDFVIMNGDVLTTIDFREILTRHRESGADLTVASQEREFPVDFGTLEVTESGAISSLVEKPRIRKLVSLGIYALSRDAVTPYIAPLERKDMTDLIQEMVQAGRNVRVFKTNCQWHDIGRPDDFRLASEQFEAHRDLYL